MHLIKIIQIYTKFNIIPQSGFRGIGSPHFKLMYELSDPDPAKCAPGLAKCAPGLAKCAPSHKWNVPRHTGYFFVLLESIELDEKDYGFQLCSWSAPINFLYTWSSLRVALGLFWGLLVVPLVFFMPLGIFCAPEHFLCPWEIFVPLDIFCTLGIFAPLEIFCAPGVPLVAHLGNFCAPEAPLGYLTEA